MFLCLLADAVPEKGLIDLRLRLFLDGELLPSIARVSIPILTASLVFSKCTRDTDDDGADGAKCHNCITVGTECTYLGQSKKR